MTNKYELDNEIVEWRGVTLYRIKALRDIKEVSGVIIIKKGQLGGLVDSVARLSQDGNCWIGTCAKVYGNAEVCGNAGVGGHAEVSGQAEVYGNAYVYGNAMIKDYARILGNVQVYGDTCIGGVDVLSGDIHIENGLIKVAA